MLTSCYICRGDITARKETVTFQWGKKVLVFENVPTHICNKCGEKYFDAMVYHRLEKLSEIHVSKAKPPAGGAIQFGEPTMTAEQ